MTTKAVVLGGAGFLGRRLVARLAGEGAPSALFDAVHVLDTAAWRPLGPTAAPVTAEIGDVRSEADLRRALEGAHTVFHAASIVDVGLRPNPAIDAVNVGGTRNVVAAARARGVAHLVYTSSEDVVFSETPVRGGDESLPYPARPMHDYVRTKIEAERLVLAADGVRGLRTVSLRPVHIYGPEDPHAIVTTLRAFARGTVPVLLGDGRARFDIVYVDNVAHAHVLAAARLATPDGAARVGGRAYFVGEDNAPNYFEFVRPYAEAVGVSMPRRHLGRRRTHAVARLLEGVHRVTGREVPFHRFHAHAIGEDFFFSGARARAELGYAPVVSPAEGQARTIAWLRRMPFEPGTR